VLQSGVRRSREGQRPIATLRAASSAFLFAVFLIQPLLSQGQAVNELSAQLSKAITQSGKKTVAVVDFTDLQGHVTEFGRFLAEEFSVALAGSPSGFKVIDRTNLKTILQEHKLASTGIIDPQTARKLGEITGVQALVTGTVTPFGDDLRISVKVLDAETAEIIKGVAADMPRNKAIDELLARGIAGGDQSASAPPTNNDRKATGPTPPGTTPISATSSGASDLSLTIQQCEYGNEDVKCWGLATNTSELSAEICTESSQAVDDEGNSHMLGSEGFTIGGNRRQRLMPNVPVRFFLHATEISPKATKLNFDIHVDWNYHGPHYIFKDVPIQKRSQ
jgi:TolB-like protein